MLVDITKYLTIRVHIAVVEESTTSSVKDVLINTESVHLKLSEDELLTTLICGIAKYLMTYQVRFVGFVNF